MPKQYVVIAGAVPALITRKKEVKMGDILDEKDFHEGEISELCKQEFIEEYKPYTVTAADLEKNQHLVEHAGMEEGDEIHLNMKGFTPAEAPAEREESKPAPKGKSKNKKDDAGGNQ